MDTRPLLTPERPWSIIDAHVLGAKSVFDEIQVTKKILSMSPIVVQRIYFICQAFKLVFYDILCIPQETALFLKFSTPECMQLVNSLAYKPINLLKKKCTEFKREFLHCFKKQIT